MPTISQWRSCAATAAAVAALGSTAGQAAQPPGKPRPTPPQATDAGGYFLPPEWVRQHRAGVAWIPDLNGLQAYTAVLVAQPARLNDPNVQATVSKLYDCSTLGDEFKRARDLPAGVARFNGFARSAKREGILHMQGFLGPYDGGTGRFSWKAGLGQTPYFTMGYIALTSMPQCRGGDIMSVLGDTYSLKLTGVKLPGLAMPPAQAEALVTGDRVRLVDIDIHFRLTGSVNERVVQTSRGSLEGPKAEAEFTGAEIKRHSSDVVLGRVVPGA